MRHRSTVPAILVAGVLLTCTSCLELVVSAQPWLEADGSGEADVSFDARLLGWWCADDYGCEESEAMYWAPGPGQSYDVLVDGRLAYRAWLGRIGAHQYLDFRFLCEPAQGTAEDDCHEAVGSHFIARVARLEHSRVELQLLNAHGLEERLESGEESLVHGTLDGTVVLIETTEELGDFLRRSAASTELWDEEGVTMTRSYERRKP